jgi:hypothetical protein
MVWCTGLNITYTACLVCKCNSYSLNALSDVKIILVKMFLKVMNGVFKVLEENLIYPTTQELSATLHTV